MAPRLSVAAMAIAAAPLLLSLDACQKSARGGASAPNPVVHDTDAPPPAEVAASRAATATNVGPTTPSPIVTRADFAKAAAIGDLYEIQSGKLALQRSKTPAVRSFAQRMIRDHTESDVTLGKTLGNTGVGVGVTPATDLDASHKAVMDKLAGAPATDFDRTYMNQQVTAHQQAADLFQGYAQDGDAPSLQNFAQHALPMIDDHLAKAQQLQLSLATGAGPANPSPQ